MTRKEQKYPRKISRRILILCFLLISILCSAITILSYREYKASVYERYHTYLKTILEIALEEADAKGIQEAVETQTKNQAYEDLSEHFNRYMEHSSIQYIYALYFKEQDQKMYYVLNGYTAEMERTKPEGIHGLGDVTIEEEWEPELVEGMRRIFSDGCKDIQYTIDSSSDNELLMTAYFPLCDEQGNVVCIMGVDASMYRIISQLNHFTEKIVIGAVLFGVIFLLGLFFLLRLRIIRPIKKLADSTYHFISQQEDKSPEELVFVSADIHSRDEIQLLSDSLENMVSQIKDYMGNVKKFTAEQERVNAQFGIVQQLKENLFPFDFPAFQDRTDFSIYADIQFSKKRSGDFYNFFLIDPNHICFFAGTASGSGVTTTMIAMIATIYMENYARLGYQPNRILSETNNRLSENNSGEITVNTFLGIVELDTGDFVYAQVGETAPVIKKSGNDAELLECTPGFPLGSLENVVYMQQKMRLAQGESIFVYTEGIPERSDAKGYEYTADRVLQEWNVQLQTNYELSKMVAAMQNSLHEFAKDTVQEADETMLVFRYVGK